MSETAPHYGTLKAPFTYFGGKSRIAAAVWERFGDVPSYIEPFCGSCAVLLARPSAPRVETVNDMDCMIANFWRATKSHALDTADWADYPVIEEDMFARHTWLNAQAARLREGLEADPDWCDPKIAGWWAWGQSAWIASGWCAGTTPRQLPHLSGGGDGVHRKLPHLGDAGKGAHKQLPLQEWFTALSVRLRRVRVCCGDWKRITGPSVTTHVGVPTAVFLDPPYSAEAGRDNNIYTHESVDVAHECREWAIAHGDDPMFRIALCGYEGEHTMPDSWTELPWKAVGGYGSQRRDKSNENAKRERVYFSPHCLQPELF